MLKSELFFFNYFTGLIQYRKKKLLSLDRLISFAAGKVYVCLH